MKNYKILRVKGSLHLLLVHLLLILGGGVLILLILGNKIVHVGLSLCELHLVHTLASVPMEESLATEHACELLRDTLPKLLDGGGVTNEDGSHLKPFWRDVADRRLDVVGDPLHEVGGVLVLHVEHLLVDLFGGHASTEECRARQVATMTRIAAHIMFL